MLPKASADWDGAGQNFPQPPPARCTSRRNGEGRHGQHQWAHRHHATLIPRRITSRPFVPDGSTALLLARGLIGPVSTSPGARQRDGCARA